MKFIGRWVSFSIAFLCCISANSYADDFHYNNILIGDRASGMGGAYTAISDDASGMFYNPAGIVYISDRNFSASVNAYSAQYKTYDNVIGGQPFKRQSNALLANYFGIVKSVGDMKIGFLMQFLMR
jgi:long-subunit fatty acid transport protein